jgi:hypothetical protein
MDYYNRPEVSNSTLTALKMELAGESYPENSNFLFGSLVDAMITEPNRVDRFAKTLDGIDCAEIWNGAFNCAKAIRNHKTYHFIANSEKQKVSTSIFNLNWNGLEYSLPVRCKWDFFGYVSGDIKTTSATSQKQFEEQCEFLEYYRGRAFYMDIENTNKDLLIAVSKVNYKVFTKIITRNDEFYNKGREQYEELCFKYWALKINN